MSARRQRLGSEGVRGGARGAKREKAEINRNKGFGDGCQRSGD